jgi:uncharacterized protein
MIDRFRRLMPSPETAANNRWLRWLGPSLLHPRLWHMSRRGIALGCAIGVFFGFLVPLAQIPLSAGAAVLLRANIPSAMASTLVTNPVTFPPVYYAAWQVGHWILGGDAAKTPPPSQQGEPPDEPPATAATTATGPAASAAPGWWHRTWDYLTGVGKPLLIGLGLFACGFGFLTWLLVGLVWRLRVLYKRRQRLRASA